MMMKRILVGFCVLLSLSATGQNSKEDTNANGKKSFTIDDDNVTFQLASAGSAHGMPGMMDLLGNLYETGRGTKKDYMKAMEWYLKAADKGDADAPYHLGHLYEKGLGVKQNDEKALKWYQKAAERNSESGIKAMKALQRKVDLAKRMEAAKNSTSSAKDNYAKAQNLYAQKDFDNAFKLFQLSGDQGYGLAQSQVGLMYLEGKGVGSDYAVGAEWLEKAADQKVPDAEYMLGVLYLKGEGISQDEKRGLSLVQRAAKHGSEDAKYYLESQKLDKAKKEARKNRANQPSDPYTFAVVIGNEKYKNEAEVPFAQNDAKAFKDYVMITLGVKDESHIKLVENAGLNDLLIAVEWLVESMKKCGEQGKAIFYYAGHGIPNEKDGSAYLLPVDGIGNVPRSGLSLAELYETLGGMQVKSVTVFLDACFSGAKREGGMMNSARGVAIKSKQSSPYGNMVVFTAAQGDETAYPWKEQEHGLFTYYLLKKLDETDGDVTLGELSDYLEKQVRRQSFVNSGKMQTPATLISSNLQGGWRTMKLR